MLSFFYDVIDKYISRKDYCLLEMDTGEKTEIKFTIHNFNVVTFKSRRKRVKIEHNSYYFSSDSLYLSLSAATLDELVKPHLKVEWEREKDKWFPRTDTPENRAFDKRKPGKLIYV